ncbi:glycogen synthase GlgA [Uliginosibacterium sp. H1]|uniref:glycogen synthase GlgA n=1 Tax=Uliginosibacterium sp. H1 TaxID=3114757 RepID=UPI002E1775C8|nr:glycogen synthase GlgA [Uliginosibacterium sp. H1]
MKTPKLRILFATPECAPWIKTGGLGDVSAALPHALAELGHEVRVLMPFYSSVKPKVRGARLLAELPQDGAMPACSLLVAKMPNGVTAWLIDCPDLFERDGTPYQNPRYQDHSDNHLRFGLLSRVAAVLASGASPVKWRPHVLHCNDWPTGLGPAYLKLGLPDPAASVMTIHNIAFQGIYPMHLADALMLPPESRQMEGIEYWGQMSFLKAGLYYADAITAVSPTYAREVQGEELGFGMQGLMRARADRLTGILNGIDTNEWDPANDSYLTQRYSVNDLAGKAANRKALRLRMGLRESNEMVLGMACRLTAQKGVDLVIETADRLMSLPVQLAILGSGDIGYERELQALVARHPGRISAHLGFSESLAHVIESGSDAFLMPSRFEPCGLNQMYSQRYGTPPIVNATGGLADSVIDFDPAASKGDATGFRLAHATAAGLYDAVVRAVDAFGQPAVWAQLQRNGMQVDFGWQRSAASYVEVYRKAIGLEAADTTAVAEPAVPAPALPAPTTAKAPALKRRGRSPDVNVA